MNQLIAITAGDVAGIGPEVLVRAMQDDRDAGTYVPILLGHPDVFRSAGNLVGHSLNLHDLSTAAFNAETFRDEVIRISANGKIPFLNPAGDDVLLAPRCEVSAPVGDAAYKYLMSAIQLAKSRCVDAIVTAPLNKEALHLAGHHYPGHTEILAEHCGVREFAMMLHLPETSLRLWRQLIQPLGSRSAVLSKDGLSIAHVTLHTSVASVPTLLTVESVAEKIRLMSNFLSQIRCERKAIAVCALNPHGGENGLFGDEEQRVIAPAIRSCQPSIANLTGPMPVDTLIRRAISGEFDAVIAMYHDQGHIPVKLIGFDSAVNITLGLPIVRTSPTHGTAFDRAWNPATPADASGMIEAIRMAVVLAESVQQTKFRV